MVEGVIEIRNIAFGSCKKLKWVAIPASVISIGEGAFNNCRALTKENMPTAIT